MQWIKLTSHKNADKNPNTRKGYRTALIKESLYLFGGVPGKEYKNDLWRLDLKQMTWTEVKRQRTGEIPRGRGYHSLNVVLDGHFLYLFGGEGPRDKQCLNDGFLFNAGAFDL